MCLLPVANDSGLSSMRDESAASSVGSSMSSSSGSKLLERKFEAIYEMVVHAADRGVENC